MAKRDASQPLRAPLMYAFRAAIEARDGKKQVDLRTEDGERILSSRRTAASGRRALSESELKRLLAEDLEALLNTVNLESAADDIIGDLPHVRKSILNFGLRDMANKTIEETERIDGIREDLIDALRAFEPRLLYDTLEVVRDHENEDDLTIRFVVRSDMRASPEPAPIEFVTEVELDSGEIKINRS